MTSDDIIANAVRQYWKKSYAQDVIVFFYQKYDFEKEWEWCSELGFPESATNYESVIFENDFYEGQTCVKDIHIVPLEEITKFYAEKKLGEKYERNIIQR